MKKNLSLFGFIFCLSILSISNVFAEDASDNDILVVFVDNQTSMTINTTTGATSGIPERVIAIGDTINFEAMSCAINEDMVNQTTKEVIVLKEDCQPVNAALTSSNASVLTMNNSVGTVKGYGVTTITAKADGYSDYSLQYSVTEQGSASGTDTDVTPSTSVWKYLIIVDNSTKKITLDKNKGTFTPKISKTIYVGDKVQFYAYICSDTKATKNSNQLTWNVSDCEKPKNVSWSKGDGNNPAFTIDQNGLVVAKKSGFGFDSIHAKVNQSDVVTGNNIYFNSAHNNVEVIVQNAVNNGSSNTTNSGKNTSSYDVKVGNTANNTSMLIIIVGIAMIGLGGYLIYIAQKDRIIKKKN